MIARPMTHQWYCIAMHMDGQCDHLRTSGGVNGKVDVGAHLSYQGAVNDFDVDDPTRMGFVFLRSFPAVYYCS